MMNIADRIQHLRKLKGISQEELADKIGVSRQTVSKWESEQSVPDINKVVIMSDFFEVTSDYLLKGIEETPKGSAKKRELNANIIFMGATAFNFIGLLVAMGLWYETQEPLALVAGLILMTVGCVNFGIGMIYSTHQIEQAKRKFWMFNVWILTFMPLSFLYNVMFTGFNAPYPVHIYTTAFPIFLLIYLTIGLTVTFVKAKK